MATSSRNDARSAHGSRAVPVATPAAEPAVASRRSFLRRGALVAAAGGVAGGGYLAYQAGEGRRLVFATLAEAMQEVERLASAAGQPQAPTTAWNWSQTLEHCAQSIEFSLHGFPAPKSALFQHTVGAAAFQVFAQRGRMSHNLAEPIPGAPALAAAPSADPAALIRLRKAVHDFASHAGPLHPHFAYGDLSRAQYEQAHAMHLANHLSVFDARS